MCWLSAWTILESLLLKFHYLTAYSFVQDACRISDPKTFESWGLSRKAVTTTFLDVFSASIFNWGWVRWLAQ